MCAIVKVASEIPTPKGSASVFLGQAGRPYTSISAAKAHMTPKNARAGHALSASFSAQQFKPAVLQRTCAYMCRCPSPSVAAGALATAVKVPCRFVKACNRPHRSAAAASRRASRGACRYL